MLGIPEAELVAMEVLSRNAVDYLLIGGYAMRFYGSRRYAEDVDILANNSTENVRKLFETIRTVLGYTPNFTADELMLPRKRISLAPHGPALDILTSVDGLDFETAHSKRESVIENGIPISVVSKEDLLFIKRSAAARDEKRRREEQADIAFLES
jgi:hypothetical protein